MREISPGRPPAMLCVALVASVAAAGLPQPIACALAEGVMTRLPELAVVDGADHAARNAYDQVSRSDLEAYESRHGRIPDSACSTSTRSGERMRVPAMRSPPSC